MVVKLENDNKVDENTMGVWMPSIQDIPVTFHESVTRAEKHGRLCQKVNEIAGMFVGRVPVNFGKVFTKLGSVVDSITWCV